MVQLLNSITFIICLAPLILCISNAAERRHEIDVAHGDEDIFRNTPPPLPPPSSPSKIDIYVHDWIRKVLEANETESPADVQKDGNYPPITKDFYQVGMKWIIKKYCLNVSSENACMQVVLKPHVYEEIPLKFRLFRKGIDPDSNVNGLDEKEVLKGYSAKKLKNKYFKDEKNYKNRNAFDQFYKYLIKRKKKLLSSSKNTKSENFIEIVTEQSSLGAFSNSSLEQALKNLKRKGEIKETDKKKAPTFLEKSEYRPGIDQSKKIVYEFLEKVNGETDNKDDAMIFERKEKKEQNEIKERNKRSAKNKKGKNIKETTPLNKKKNLKRSEEEDYDDNDDEDDDNDDGLDYDDDKKEVKYDDDDDDDDDDEGNEEDDDDEDDDDEGDANDQEGMPNDYRFYRDNEEFDSSADDSSAHDSKDHDKYETGMHDPSVHEPNAGIPDVYDPREHELVTLPDVYDPREHELVPLPDVYDPREHELVHLPEVYDPREHELVTLPDVYDPREHEQVHLPEVYDPREHELVPLPDVYDPNAQESPSQDQPEVSEYTSVQDWNRCQLPSPRKTSEVLCKVLPQKMICKLYCIHGHTFPEGITRETVCELKKGVWSKKFDECLPFVDCTLKLKTAGYLKCTTNTVQTGPRCQVECQRYATKPAVSKKTHQCDVTGRWNPPLPHCVEREGIDVVQPPPNMSLRSMDYP
ncbi:probable serine/threonine-protein kinase kinX [Argiope bruennichi]|uniref:probable serine/threonine-protein kinase kinX n=1 Tax=Argiope bruennichi TaxID=94029 RepID=UPI0024949A6C|nr:probable serine/threonine-protein kinase kinX [Argiope bruennichi]